MPDDQRSARMFGVLFVITFLTSIPAALLYQSVLADPAGYIAGGGTDTQIYLAAFLEFLLIIANVGTAVVLYPIARRQNETLAKQIEAQRAWLVRLTIATLLSLALAIAAISGALG